MNVFTCTKFTGHWPVGVGAVVVAEGPVMAAIVLNEELRLRGLAGDAKSGDMIELLTHMRQARVLNDGDY